MIVDKKQLEEMIGIVRRQRKPSLYVLGGAAVIFFVSLLVWLIKFPGVRRIFFFQSAENGRVYMETRYEPVRPVQGGLRLYVDELLLGPETERCLPLFSDGTRTVSCFQRHGDLYVNLSSEALNAGQGASDIKKGIELLRKNIRYNFKSIRTVDVFVDNKPVYENF